MTDNTTTPASQQPQSVVQQLWLQQYAYYSKHKIPGVVPQPVEARTTQQPSTAYAPPAYGQVQRTQPVAHSAQHEGSTGYGYAAQAPTTCQYPYPYAYQYWDATAAPANHLQHTYSAPLTKNQNSYSAPSLNTYNYSAQAASTYNYSPPAANTYDYSPPSPNVYNYNTQYHSSPVNASLSGSAAVPPSYGWPGFANRRQVPQSNSINTYRSSSRANRNDTSGTRSRYSRNRYPTGSSHQPSSGGRDNHRPPWRNESPRDEYFTTSPNQHTLQALASDKTEPRGNHSRNHSTATKSVVAYPPPLERYEKQYTASVPAFFKRFALAPDTAPFTPRHVPGIIRSKATKFIPTYRRSQEASGHGNQDIGTSDKQARQQDTEHESVGRVQDVLPLPQHSATDVFHEASCADNNAAVTVGPQVTAWPRIGEDLARRLSEPDMQVVSQPETTESANTSIKAVIEVIEPIVAEATTGFAPSPVTEPAEPDHSNDSVKPAAPDAATVPAKAAWAHANLKRAPETVTEVAQPQAGDDAQLVPTHATAELNQATANILPALAEAAAVYTQPVQDQVTDAMTDVADIASSLGPMNTNSADHAPQKKRLNRNQKKRLKKEDQDGDASPHSRSSTESSISSLPHKHVEEKPVPSPVDRHPGRPVANGWGNFFAHIKQDDDALKERLEKERERERKTGNSFRPEIKETYKDQKGTAETTVHEKVGTQVVMKEDSDGDEEVGGVKLETSSDMDIKME